MSENHDAGSVSEQQPWVAGDEEKTQFVDRSALQQPTAATPDAGEHTQVVPPAVVAPQQWQPPAAPPYGQDAPPAAPQWQPPQPPAGANPYGQDAPPAAPQWQPPQPGYQPSAPQPQFGQPGAPVPPQPEQPWNSAGAPVPPPAPGFGAPTYGAPGFGAPVPPPGFGPQPGGPQFPGPAGPQPTPVDMAKSLLNKGDSFIFRLMTRGVRGELIQQPWFQNMRTNPQGSNQFVYIGYAGAVLLGLFLSLLGAIGSIVAFAIWLGLAYCFLALGTKLSAQFVAYGICGVGAAASLLGLLMGVIGLAGFSGSPYVSGTLMAMLVLARCIS